MRPNEVELFALERLFSGAEPICEAIRRGLGGAIVVERSLTGVGFFSTIRFVTSLPESEQRQWDWNFSHSKLPNGGSFMVWREGADVIELEAVSHFGDWPMTFNASDFVDTP